MGANWLNQPGADSNDANVLLEAFFSVLTAQNSVSVIYSADA